MKYSLYSTILVLLLCLVCTGCGKRDSRSRLSIEGRPGRVLVLDRKTTVKLDKTMQIQLPAGRHLLEVSEPGHETVYTMTVLKPGKKYSFKPSMRQISSGVLIESEPRGAKVEFQGSVKGTTPIVIRDLTPGKYTAHLSMPGFAKREVTWIIKDARPLPKIKAVLASNTAKVRISSKPAGAKIYIDDVQVGTTPFEGNIETGQHRLKLVRKGYVEHITQLNINKPAAISKTFALRARPGVIRLISTPAGAAVSINGEKRGNTPITLELDAGKHKITVEKDGFDPTEKRITVVPAQKEEMIINLCSATGSARFLIYPGNVSMRLDGKDMGKVPTTGDGPKEVVFKNLTPGTHILDLSHPLANSSTKPYKFKIIKGQMYQPDKPIEIWVRNCEVTHVDGRKEQGMLYYKNQEGIMFGHMPKIKFFLKNNQYKSLRMLSND